MTDFSTANRSMPPPPSRMRRTGGVKRALLRWLLFAGLGGLCAVLSDATFCHADHLIKKS